MKHMQGQNVRVLEIPILNVVANHVNIEGDGCWLCCLTFPQVFQQIDPFCITVISMATL